MFVSNDIMEAKSQGVKHFSELHGKHSLLLVSIEIITIIKL